MSESTDEPVGSQFEVDLYRHVEVFQTTLTIEGDWDDVGAGRGPDVTFDVTVVPMKPAVSYADLSLDRAFWYRPEEDKIKMVMPCGDYFIFDKQMLLDIIQRAALLPVIDDDRQVGAIDMEDVLRTWKPAA